MLPYSSFLPFFCPTSPSSHPLFILPFAYPLFSLNPSLCSLYRPSVPSSTLPLSPLFHYPFFSIVFSSLYIFNPSLSAFIPSRFQLLRPSFLPFFYYSFAHSFSLLYIPLTLSYLSSSPLLFIPAFVFSFAYSF